MKNRKIEKNTQSKECKLGKKAENREKTQPEKSKRGEKVEKRGKNPAGGKQVV